MNYVFITGYDRSGSNIAINTADASAIFMDGTMDVIKVNVTATDKNMRDRDYKGNVDPDYDAKYDSGGQSALVSMTRTAGTPTP